MCLTRKKCPQGSPRYIVRVLLYRVQVMIKNPQKKVFLQHEAHDGFMKIVLAAATTPSYYIYVDEVCLKEAVCV